MLLLKTTLGLLTIGQPKLRIWLLLHEELRADSGVGLTLGSRQASCVTIFGIIENDIESGGENKIIQIVKNRGHRSSFLGNRLRRFASQMFIGSFS